MKQHFLSERFWVDEYTAELDPTEKLLFCYLLTNHFLTCYGIYDIPLRNIAFDTGIDKDAVLRILERFDADQKITYWQNKTIIIHNWYKYQSYNLPDVQNYVTHSLSQLPQQIREAYPQVIQNLKSKTLTSNTPAKPQRQARRTPATPQPDSTILNYNFTNLSSSPPISPPKNPKPADGRMAGADPRTPRMEEEEEERKDTGPGGQAPQTPQDDPAGDWGGITIRDSEVRKLQHEYPDLDIGDLLAEIGHYYAQKDEVIKNPYRTAKRWAENTMKRRMA